MRTKKKPLIDLASMSPKEISDLFKSRHGDLKPAFTIHVIPDLDYPYNIAVSTSQDPRAVVLTFPRSHKPDWIAELGDDVEIRTMALTGISGGFLSFIEISFDEPDLTPEHSVYYISDKSYSVVFYGCEDLVELTELVRLPRLVLSQKRRELDGEKPE